jgi:DNA-binding MarR family transcriptional regulator
LQACQSFFVDGEFDAPSLIGGDCSGDVGVMAEVDVNVAWGTTIDSRALGSLSPQEGRTMRSLVDEWERDASNATWIVDRLERFGLAERRSVPHDRRVTLAVLTARGLKTKTELMEEFLTPPADLLDLSQGDLEALRRALEVFPQPARPSAAVASTKTKRR